LIKTFQPEILENTRKKIVASPLAEQKADLKVFPKEGV